MSTKLLNLDELASGEGKTIKLAGFEHRAVEMTVQGYIDRVAKAKQVSPEPQDEAGNLERAMQLVQEVFPTLTSDILRGLTLPKLKVIIEFALAAPDDIAAKAEAAAPGPDAAGNA